MRRHGPWTLLAVAIAVAYGAHRLSPHEKTVHLVLGSSAVRVNELRLRYAEARAGARAPVPDAHVGKPSPARVRAACARCDVANEPHRQATLRVPSPTPGQDALASAPPRRA